nr:Kinase superfamily protein isoform 2 [Ipomoea batatas]
MTCTPSSPFSRRPPPTTRHSLLSVRPPPPAHCLPLAFNLRRPPFPTSSRVQPSPPLLDCRRHTPPPPLPICLVKELLQNLGLGEHISHTPTKNMDIVSSLDLALLQKIARRKNDFRLYADELGKGLAGELDYTLEAANASEFMLIKQLVDAGNKLRTLASKDELLVKLQVRHQEFKILSFMCRCVVCACDIKTSVILFIKIQNMCSF